MNHSRLFGFLFLDFIFSARQQKKEKFKKPKKFLNKHYQPMAGGGAEATPIRGRHARPGAAGSADPEEAKVTGVSPEADVSTTPPSVPDFKKEEQICCRWPPPRRKHGRETGINSENWISPSLSYE
jgi:hypothetical protein